MNAILTDVVSSIKEKTGIDIDLYDILGEKLASTNGVGEYKYVDHLNSEFESGYILDLKNNLTYFVINQPRNNLVGVIKGADTTAKNYAFMLSALIENSLTKSDTNLSKNDAIKAILKGEISKTQKDRLNEKFEFPSNNCYVLSVVCGIDRQGEIYNLLTEFSEELDMVIIIDEKTLAYIKFYDLQEEYQAPTDFAEIVMESIKNELNADVVIGVGGKAENFFETGNSFSQAQSAIRMGNLVSNRFGIYSYKDYILIRMIEDIPKPVLKHYSESLIDSGVKEILSDGDMIATAEEFLNTSLNISETSRNLFMHRNTLLYKLDKIEKAMGLNIRRFSDAMAFRIITILYKLLKK